jgi:hypothetical protein
MVARRAERRGPTDSELAALRDQPKPEGGNYVEYYLAQTRRARELWLKFGPRELQLWIEKHPGTRPTMWWRFDAPRCAENSELPELRHCLGGTGTPASETMAYKPELPLGIPVDWDVDFDEADPPLYEAQASYLKRHGLLVPGELKRLTKEDFEPEAAVDSNEIVEDEDEAEA